MGNVFCSFSALKTIDVQPVFHLDAKSGVIKDLSCFNAKISNYGVTIANDTQEGRCLNFINGYIDTAFLDLFKEIWNFGEFSLEFRIKFNSIPQTSYIFGSCRNQDANAPGTIYATANGKIFIVNSPAWGSAIHSDIDINAWNTVCVVSKNKQMSLFINNELKREANMSGSVRDYPLLIGDQTSRNGAGVQNLKIKGQISYFKIFNTAIK